MPDIAAELGVARSSVSLWTHDVPFTPGPRRGRRRGPNVLQRRKEAEIADMLELGREWIGELSDKEFLVAGAALYAGEGSKSAGAVQFANSDPRMMAFFAFWLRTFFTIDEPRLRMRIYLHQGLDLDAAVRFWSDTVQVPPEQFRAAYRAVPDPSIRLSKHEHGCAYLWYSCTRTHRQVMGLVAALLACPDNLPG
jgi:hypothetical protein